MFYVLLGMETVKICDTPEIPLLIIQYGVHIMFNLAIRL